MFASEHEPLAFLIELTPKHAKKDFVMTYINPGTTNVLIAMKMQQV